MSRTAITRDAALSDSGADSETDEELHPLVLKPPRYAKPADSKPADIDDALHKHGAATIADPVISQRDAARAFRGLALLRDSQLTFMFANANQTAASPGACEALHMDDSALTVLRACDKRGHAALVRAISASEETARAALGGSVVRTALPMVAIGEGVMSERWHTGADGCPSSGGGVSSLMSVLVLDDGGNEALRTMPPPSLAGATGTAPTARRAKRHRTAGSSDGVGGCCKWSPRQGQLTLVAHETFRAAIHASGSAKLIMWWRRADADGAAGATSVGQSSVKPRGLGIAPKVYDGVLDEEARAALANTKPIRWACYDRQV